MTHSYAIYASLNPPACLPVDLDISGLEDITRLTDSWRIYRDPNTGKVHDGAVYARRLQEEVFADSPHRIVNTTI